MQLISIILNLPSESLGIDENELMIAQYRWPRRVRIPPTDKSLIVRLIVSGDKVSNLTENPWNEVTQNMYSVVNVCTHYTINYSFRGSRSLQRLLNLLQPSVWDFYSISYSFFLEYLCMCCVRFVLYKHEKTELEVINPILRWVVAPKREVWYTFSYSIQLHMFSFIMKVINHNQKVTFSLIKTFVFRYFLIDFFSELFDRFFSLW